MIKDIFFDLDHTLWDFETNAQLAYARCFEDISYSISSEDFMHIYRPVNREYWKKYREGKVDKQGLQYGRLKDSFNKLQMEISDTDIQRISELFLSYLPTFNHLFPGAREVLEYAAGKYRLHIITNGFDEVQIPKLRNARIDVFFETVITAEQAGVRKPDPIIFHKAFELSGATPQRSIMIGDSYEADIQGAALAGMKGILFDPDNEATGVHTPRIVRLVELLDLI